MTLDKYRLKREDDQWKLIRQGADRASLTAPTKEEALKDTSKFLNEHGGSVRIYHAHKPGVQEERTYPRKDDPRRSPG